MAQRFTHLNTDNKIISHQGMRSVFIFKPSKDTKSPEYPGFSPFDLLIDFQNRSNFNQIEFD